MTWFCPIVHSLALLVDNLLLIRLLLLLSLPLLFPIFCLLRRIAFIRFFSFLCYFSLLLLLLLLLLPLIFTSYPPTQTTTTVESASLQAAIYALLVARHHERTYVQVHSDSDFLRNSVTKLSIMWHNYGWKTPGEGIPPPNCKWQKLLYDLQVGDD